MGKTILEVKNVYKNFGGVKALQDVSLSLKEAEIHALVGENGAGKSTLIKILTGVIKMDEGEIILNGEKTKIENPLSARINGIVAIYQELSLIENLSVAINIFLGHEPIKKIIGWIDNKTLMDRASKYLKEFKIETDLNSRISEIGLGEKRIIEILKAMSINAKILLFDEPTTGMSATEIDTLFRIMDKLKKKKIPMFYISHNMEEIFRICDKVTVLRNGRNVGTYKTNAVDHKTLVRTMLGRKIEEEYPKRKLKKSRDILLQTEDFFAKDMLKKINLNLYKGEILGVTGTIGAGKSEIGEAFFAVTKKIEGKLRMKGREINFKAPIDAYKNGIAYIPEDRKTQGLFLNYSIEDNLLITNINKAVIGKLFISSKKKRKFSLDISKKLRIVPLDMTTSALNLSGGNQQKVVIGKWLIGSPEILIMDEPTRGIDVGAKVEVFNLINNLADSGVGIIILSSEFQEVKNICDRIIILRNGEIVKEIDSKDITTEEIFSLSLGAGDGK